MEESNGAQETAEEANKEEQSKEEGSEEITVVLDDRQKEKIASSNLAFGCLFSASCHKNFTRMTRTRFMIMWGRAPPRSINRRINQSVH